jgi:hypothetical protein
MWKTYLNGVQVSIHNHWSHAKKIKETVDLKKNCTEFPTDPGTHFKKSVKVVMT